MGSSTIYNLSTSGIEAQEILKYLYDKSNIYMDRKFKLYIESLNWRKK